MQMRFIIPSFLALANISAHANIEWPVLYGTRAVEFTEALVRQCDSSFPNGAEERRTAFIAWKSRNQAAAVTAREFNLDRLRRQDPKVSVGDLQRSLDELQGSALLQASKTMEAWEGTCKKMSAWLMSDESDVERQVPDFMFPAERKQRRP